MSNHTKNGLSKTNRINLYVSVITLFVSGLVWLIMHYFIRVKAEFGGLSHHNLEHKMLVIHGIFAYAFVFIFGTIWNSHVKKWFKAGKKNFKSGVLMVSIIFLLIITGIMLYYIASDHARNIASVIHSAVGASLSLVFVLHIVNHKPKKNH